MADPAFAEMETEAEEFTSGASIARRRNQQDDKLMNEPLDDVEQRDTSPLLGPTVLTDRADKPWYNTPSVGPWGWSGVNLGILAVARFFVDSIEFWVDDGA